MYNVVSEQWIMSVKNFSFFNSISETMLSVTHNYVLLYISLERSFYSASAHVSCTNNPFKNGLDTAS